MPENNIPENNNPFNGAEEIIQNTAIELNGAITENEEINGAIENNNQEHDNQEARFRFIDLFAGIGGFHYAMHSAGGECVFASEWDKYARITYEHNFRNISPGLFQNGFFNSDINDLNTPELLDHIPDFDVLCAGFPCQPFSNAGLKRGFEDTRGTLFFKIAEIVDHKINRNHKPRVLLLENVKGLISHDGGNTLKQIIRILKEVLHYKVDKRVLNAKYFGVPQNRERLFIVAWPDNPDTPQSFNFPLGLDVNGLPVFDEELLESRAYRPTVGTILENEPDPRYTISDRLYQGHLRRRKEHAEKGNGFGFSMFNEDSPYTSTISARYYKDGSEILIDRGNGNNPRKLTPQEAGRLQGYNILRREDIPVSDVQAYKQFGNSVAVPVVTAIANEIVRQLL